MSGQGLSGHGNPEEQLRSGTETGGGWQGSLGEESCAQICREVLAEYRGTEEGPYETSKDQLWGHGAVYPAFASFTKPNFALILKLFFSKTKFVPGVYSTCLTHNPNTFECVEIPTQENCH